jgi:hypothetical protein
MIRHTRFAGLLTARERRLLDRIDSPEKIQRFLDSIEYCSDDVYHCPLTLIRTNTGCCFAGGLFAAMLLRRWGLKPRIIELVAQRDDDHILAVYKKNGFWGAVAKSHYVGLRSRQPVYRTLRELVMSYFELYYNLKSEYTLRGYTLPLDPSRFDHLQWESSDTDMDTIAAALDKTKHVRFFPGKIAAGLSRVDPWIRRAGVLQPRLHKRQGNVGPVA